MIIQHLDRITLIYDVVRHFAHGIIQTHFMLIMAAEYKLTPSRLRQQE